MDKKPRKEPKARPMPMDAEIGANLKRLRVATGWSQDDLVEVMGFTKGLISGLENGDKPFNSTTITAAANAFGLSYKVLVYGGVELEQAISVLTKITAQKEEKERLLKARSSLKKAD